MYEECRPGVFREEGFEASSIHLTDKEYPRAAARFVYHCCDVVFWHRDPDTEKVVICLANRSQDPARDQWWVYGGSMKVGESMVQTALRHLEDDTGLEVEASRLIRLFGEAQQYLWAIGAEGLPNHVFADTFALQVSIEELEWAESHLREGEYHKNLGIRAFDQDILVGENAHPGMIRLYHEIVRISAIELN